MSVEIRIFDPPEAGAPTFRAAGRATAATAITTVERHYTPGHFAIQIPTAARHSEHLREGRLVLIDGAFWGIVDGIALRASGEGDILTAEGRQLKGLTLDRITIPPAFTAVTGAQGYDAVSGATETVMKHFVRANLLNPAQGARVVLGLEIAADQGRGLAEDKYMSRHEIVADVLAALGEASGLRFVYPHLSSFPMLLWSNDKAPYIHLLPGPYQPILCYDYGCPRRTTETTRAVSYKNKCGQTPLDFQSNYLVHSSVVCPHNEYAK